MKKTYLLKYKGKTVYSTVTNNLFEAVQTFKTNNLIKFDKNGKSICGNYSIEEEKISITDILILLFVIMTLTYLFYAAI